VNRVGIRRFAGIAALAVLAAVPIAIWAWNHVHHPMGNQLTGLPAGRLLAYGRLAGLVAGLGALFQILLVSRAGWLGRAFGFDRLARLHHVAGFALIIALLVHPVLLAMGHAAQAGVTLWEQYLDFCRNWDDVGEAAAGLWLAMVAMGFSVVVLVSRLSYEVWHATHLLFYAAVALSAGHILEVGTDFTVGPPWFRWHWIGLSVFVAATLAWYRVVRPLALFARHRFAVTGMARETADVVSVSIGGRAMDSFRCAAGQFVIVRFLAPGFRWEAHPFSVSNTPDGGDLRLTVKAVGDFTRRVPALQPGTPVVVDGPHGAMTAARCGTANVLLVAGGIGITPLRSLAGELLAQGRRVALLYANRRADGIALRSELDSMASANGNFTVVHVLSDDPAWSGEKGRIDGGMVKRLVPDVGERDVFLCGPPPMMKAVRSVLRGLSVPSGRIHDERFAL
jgi:predicted ferric reductase